MELKILDTGKGAYVEVDGKTLGEGLNGVEYRSPGNKPGTLLLEFETDKPAFMPEGYFDEVYQAFNRAEKKEVPAETNISAGQDVNGQ